MDSKNKYKRGMKLRSKQTGRVVVLRQKSDGIRWLVKCNSASHKIHEGTLDKFYEVVE